jgi:hypothetical protein
MAQTIARILTGLLGALLAGPLALQWLFAPAAQSGHLGISLDGAAAFSHMRGDTGGAFFAVGALAILGVLRREPGYLEAVSLIMACIIAGRLLSVALDGFVPEVGVAMAVELVTALAAFATARQLRAAA